MELQFNKSVCTCLDTPLREVQTQEQTQELKLSDGMPDIGRVLAAWGQAILRSKEWRGDSIAASGGLMVWVLYAPEDGTQPRCMESWIPFQLRWDLPGNTPEGSIRVLCLPRFVDARSVSARKIMVRSGISALAETFVPAETEVYIPDGMPEDVELLHNTYPVRLPREVGEKTFVLDEDLVIPPSIPQPEKVLYYTLRPYITDQKVLANKIVFRGNGNLHVLYVSEEGQIHSWDFELPFSQFAQLQGSFSADAQVDTMLSPTSLELELDDEGHLRLKAGITAQFVVDDPEMVEIVEDAYSPGRELDIHSQMLELPAVLENRRENIFGEQTIPAEANIAVDTQMLTDFPRQRRTETGVTMEIPGTIQVLYYGEDGSLQSANVRWEGQHTMPADAGSRIWAVPMPGVSQINLGSGSMIAKGELPLMLTTTGSQGLPMVTGLKLGEPRQESRRPSLILRRADSGSLWDIAKASGSTMNAIRKANQLEAEPAPGQMLLIPVR